RLPLSAETPRMDRAQTLVPEGEGVVEFGFFGPSGIVPTRGRVFVVEGVGGPQTVRSFDLAGKEQAAVPVPPVSAVYQLLAKPGGDAILSPVKTAVSPRWPFDFSDAEVVRDSAPSRDRTRG